MVSWIIIIIIIMKIATNNANEKLNTWHIT